MGDALMDLSPKQLEAIGAYVKDHLNEWIGPNIVAGQFGTDQDIRDRVIRIEESVRLGFEYMEKRFEQVDIRIEQIDKRFEQVDKRFEQSDKRFDDLIHQMDKRFEQVDKRFEQVDKRFTQMFAYFTTGFAMLGVLITLFKFLF